MAKRTPAFVDESGRIDVSNAPANVGEAHRARVRADYGLPAPAPKNLGGAWEVADAASAAVEEAVGQDRLDSALEEINDDRPILRSRADNPADEARELEYEAYKLAIEADVSLTDPEVQQVLARGWNDAREGWRAVGDVLARRRDKQRKQENIGPGAAANVAGHSASPTSAEDAARQLAAVQSGAFGSPSSQANKARRKKLMQVLRGG